MFYLTASTVLLLFYCNFLQMKMSFWRERVFDFGCNAATGIKNMFGDEKFTFLVGGWWKGGSTLIAMSRRCFFILWNIEIKIHKFSVLIAALWVVTCLRLYKLHRKCKKGSVWRNKLEFRFSYVPLNRHCL